MTKTTGAEFKRFYNDPKYWIEENDMFHEDELLMVNGVQWDNDEDRDKIPDNAKVVIIGGVVFSNEWDSDKAPGFDTFFIRWKKGQNTTILCIEVKKEEVARITALLKKEGAKILT